VRAAVLRALAALAGNDALVNLDYKAKLLDGGVVQAAVPLLAQHARMPAAPRLAAVTLAALAALPAAQDALCAAGAMPALVALLTQGGRPLRAAAALCIARAARAHIGNRSALLDAGAIPALSAQLDPPPPAPAAAAAASKAPPGEGFDAEEETCRARRAAHARAQAARAIVDCQARAADALAALLECAQCRRTYRARRPCELDLAGLRLLLPSLSDVAPCAHVSTCAELGAQALAAGAGARALALLSSPHAALRGGGALVLAGLATGAPTGGTCATRERVVADAVAGDALSALKAMLEADNFLDPSAAAGEHFAAARLAGALFSEDGMRLRACKAGLVRPLARLLFSTYGRVKGAAAVALARLCATDALCFWYQRNSERAYWDMPDELRRAARVDGGFEELREDEVAYDASREGYFVRGVFKARPRPASPPPPLPYPVPYRFSYCTPPVRRRAGFTGSGPRPRCRACPRGRCLHGGCKPMDPDAVARVR
jgi:hypothetical protein